MPIQSKYPRLLLVGVLLGGALVLASGVRNLVQAHGTEARRVQEIAWTRDRIVRVIDANRSELGLNGSKVSARLIQVEGAQCIFGDLFAFDVDDSYAFDIDEPVEVTLTYAPEFTQPFRVAWDRNGELGYAQTEEVRPEAGEGLRQATVRMDRARFAGFGILGTDFAVAAEGGLALCDLTISRSNATPPPAAPGRVRIQVVDEETGRTIAARMGIYDSTGRPPLPSDAAVMVHRYADEIRMFNVAPQLHWPAASRQAFYTTGTYEAEIPSGTYELVATKGPEYRSYAGTFDVRPGEVTEVRVPLHRFINQPARGWYSGDTHLHLMRDEVEDLAVWAMVAAEDVALGNLLEMGNITTTHFRQPAWGEAGRFARDGHMIASGQEDSRTTQRGHTIHHNLEAPVHLPEHEYFMYHKVFEASHAQGGVSGYAHWGDLFHGRRGLAVDVPFGLVDFIEVLQGGRLDTSAWYPFLNLGFKVNPAAGSDYPYFGPSLPGSERYYVRLDGPFDADEWYESFRAGHVFVTNGPMLEFTINGVGMGEELRVSRGAELDLRAVAQLNPDIDVLDRIEVVAHGEVIATVEGDGGEQVELQRELIAEESMWIAVVAHGRSEAERQGEARTLAAVAHSAPIYVIVDDEPFWKRSAVPALVQEQRQHLQDLLAAEVDPMRDLEAWETVDVLSRQWERQRRQLRHRVAEADAKYVALLEEATGQTEARRRAALGALAIMTALLAGGVLVQPGRRTARGFRLRKLRNRRGGDSDAHSGG